jgi:crotonobetainyl-CoA:carnitine CoA-transferase CaiB-like acyl-CoA transferase
MTMATDSVFAGLKVLDTASFIAGPAAATMLADLGAEVIKIEPPGHGDMQRILGSIPPNPHADANYCWHMANRNKRGMAIDLKSAGGAEVLRRLVEWADVVITNSPHRVRESLHLGYDEVARWNPRVIYADITGYGDAGPDAGLPGFDLTAYWSRSGLLASTRDAGAPPTLPVAGSGDYATAVGLYSAIVTGLYHRERTGKGTSVGTSLLAAGVWSAATLVAGALAGGEFYGLHDRTAPTNPLWDPYRSSDDRWFMLVAEPTQWPGLTKIVGHPELLDDPRFADPQSMAENSATLTALLEDAFSSQPLAHWKRLFDEQRITYGVIQTPEEAANDPQLRANDIVVPLQGDEKMKEIVSSPITVRGLPRAPATRAPELGEHNDEILRELGFGRREVERLRAGGAIPGAPEREAA